MGTTFGTCRYLRNVWNVYCPVKQPRKRFSSALIPNPAPASPRVQGALPAQQAKVGTGSPCSVSPDAPSQLPGASLPHVASVPLRTLRKVP